MAELLQNSSASTLNGGINNIVTTLTVTNGAVFPATGNFRILVDSELMLCTARASNVLTVTRGVESTTAASHSNGVAVTHVITALGLTNFIAEHSLSQTIADAKGDIISATAADTLVRKAVGANSTVLQADSTQADGLVWGGAFASYTPTWTSTGTAPALGNGTLTGRWYQIGKLVFGMVVLTMGSTTTFGTGTYFISLPTTPQTGGGVIGGAQIHDNSPAADYTHQVLPSGATMLFYSNAAPAVAVSNTTPITFASGDIITARFWYETT